MEKCWGGGKESSLGAGVTGHKEKSLGNRGPEADVSLGEGMSRFPVGQWCGCPGQQVECLQASLLP
jgi:hypothetical protein